MSEEPVAPEAAKAKAPVAFINIYFDEQNNLKLKSENLSVYAIIGILQSTIRAFEDKLSSDRGAIRPEPAPAPAPDPTPKA
jgi:hypothetical protein